MQLLYLWLFFNLSFGLRSDPKKKMIVPPLARNETKLEAIKCDITKFTKADVIVNAANEWLAGGGGVDGAIHKAAGPELAEACQEIAKAALREHKIPCPVGEVRKTPAFGLKAKFIYHTVGPQDGSRKMLTACYKNCLDQLRSDNLKSIVFPGIGVGVYHYPKKEAAEVAVSTTKKWIKENVDYTVDQITFCTFDDENLLYYQNLLLQN